MKTPTDKDNTHQQTKPQGYPTPKPVDPNKPRKLVKSFMNPEGE